MSNAPVELQQIRIARMHQPIFLSYPAATAHTGSEQPNSTSGAFVMLVRIVGRSGYQGMVGDRPWAVVH